MSKENKNGSGGYLETVAKAKPTFDFKAPSGYMFKLQRPAIAAYLTSGQLPRTLLEAILSKKSSSLSFLADETKLEDQLATFEFIGSLVRASVVHPRIVLNPTSKDEIRFEDIDDADFMAVFNWAKSGGVEGENLTKFRNGKNV